MSRYGEAISERREVRGFLTASDLAARSKTAAAELNDPQFQAFSQQTLSRLESDKTGEFIANARPRIQRMLSCLLGWTADEFSAHVGITIPEVPYVLNKNGKLMEVATPELEEQWKRSGSPKPKEVNLRDLPQGLQEAIKEFGRRFSDLLDPRWQQYLAGFQWREGVPDDPNAWLDLYRDLDRAGVVPGPGEN